MKEEASDALRALLEQGPPHEKAAEKPPGQLSSRRSGYDSKRSGGMTSRRQNQLHEVNFVEQNINMPSKAEITSKK